jgi:hypothetical protein
VAKKQGVVDHFIEFLEADTETLTPKERDLRENMHQALGGLDHHEGGKYSVEELDSIDMTRYEAAVALYARFRTLENAPKGVTDRHAQEGPEIDERNDEIDEIIRAGLTLPKPRARDAILKDLMDKYGTEAKRGEVLSEQDLDRYKRRKLSRKWLSRRIGTVMKGTAK